MKLWNYASHISPKPSPQAIGTMAVKRPAAVSQGPLRKRPAAGGQAPDKWHQHSKGWCLFFASEPTACRAAVAFRRAQLEDNFLEDGSAPEVVGNKLFVKWGNVVSGKSVKSYIYKSSRLRPVLGPQGTAEPTNFSVWEGAVAPTVPQTDDGVRIDGGYPALPEPFATKASFGPEGWLTGQPLAALEEHGFVVMRQLIPEYMHEPAYREVTNYFMEIGASFLGGHAIRKTEGLGGFDKWCDLPPAVWEREELGPFKVLFTEIPRFTMDEETGLITSVAEGGCAQKNGVKVGWRVEAVRYEKFSQPLAAKLANWQASAVHWARVVRKGAVEIEFQQMKCWTPYAIKQRWGVATSRGFQDNLGLGKCTQPEFMALQAMREVQMYVKPFVAAMRKIPPSKLCWHAEGASLKGRGQPLAEAHKDINDLGREQIVIALSDGAFPCGQAPISCATCLQMRRQDTSTWGTRFRTF